MPRPQKPYVIAKRKDSKSFILTINPSSGVPVLICREWNRRSFQNFPDELASYRNPKSRGAAESGALALVEFLKRLAGKENRPQRLLDMEFIKYLSNFWVETGAYIREKKNDGTPLSMAYIKNNRSIIEKYVKTYPEFHEIAIKDLKSSLLRDWKLWASEEKRMSGRMINMALQAMRVPVKDLCAREEVDWDPFKFVKKSGENLKEKGILTAQEVSALIRAPVIRPHYRLAVLFGCLCGLRRGEVRGLKWGDIEGDILHIRSNWQEEEGLKAPKWGSVRDVPLPEAVKVLLRPGNLEEFVFPSPGNIGEPASANFFCRALKAELAGIGIQGKWTSEPHKKGEKKGEKPIDYVDEQKRRWLSFHSLRHTFITLGRLFGISDMTIQALAGHKSAGMMEHYSHAGQAIDFAEAKVLLDKSI